MCAVTRRASVAQRTLATPTSAALESTSSTIDMIARLCGIVTFAPAMRPLRMSLTKRASSAPVGTSNAL
ncbi:hypothetical protein BE08_19720 [Sorangium cellulosum]|uniref:Uncharacterized protein n=1 Tax=Sorangium cellulosum TaxID=56 RepID=A0A150PHB5_SORCE|nr:hypothetical protein BE08_19720 [Sorangium cellulosum]